MTSVFAFDAMVLGGRKNEVLWNRGLFERLHFLENLKSFQNPECGKQGCEVANPLKAPEPRKKQSRWTSRSKVGFLESQKLGLKVGRNFFFCRKKKSLFF